MTTISIRASRPLRQTLRLRVTAAAAAVLTLTVAGCGGSGGQEATEDGVTTIKIASYAPGTAQAQIDVVNAQIDEFNKANPDIKVVGEPYAWQASTFAAQLAGGTLPITYQVPFTEGQLLIQNGQVANIDAAVRKEQWADQINRAAWAAGTGPDGQISAVPSSVYSMAVHYNRDLFAKAGLDPDKPPTTWEEFRAAAKAISERTGATGFGAMTSNNTGGWGLTTMIMASGGQVEALEGGKYTSAIDNDATRRSLTLLQQMRWTDNSLGANFLYDGTNIATDFAAGKIGMILHVSGAYPAIVTAAGMPADSYGLGAIPIENGGAALEGGNLNVVSTKATPAQQAAVVKWIMWSNFQGLLDQQVAVTQAKAAVAAKAPFGVPTIPVFSKEISDRYDGWVAEYYNVPRAQMQPYISASATQRLQAEPGGQTQAVYGVMDGLVQKVLTDRNANIDALVRETSAQIDDTIKNG